MKKTPTREALTAAEGRVEQQKGGLRRASEKCSGQGPRRPEHEPAQLHLPANGSSAAHPPWPVAGAPQLTPEEFVAAELARIRFEAMLCRPGGFAPSLFGRIR